MKLIYFNLRMILNKITVILLFITYLLINTVYLIEILNVEASQASYISINSYYLNSFFYFKLIIIFISIYIFSSCITKKGDFSCYILRMFNYSRFKMIISKLLSCYLIIFVLSFFSFVSFSGMGLLLKGFYLDKSFILGYINAFLCACVYGLIANLLMQIFDNYFIIIFIIVLYLVIGSIENRDIVANIVVFLFSKINEDGSSYYGIGHLLWLNVMYLLSDYYLYQNRDLNY